MFIPNQYGVDFTNKLPVDIYILGSNLNPELLDFF